MLDLSGAPLRCLRPETVAALGRGLDARKVLPSERGKCRDWKGLVDAANFPKDLVPNANASPSPTQVLVDHWKKAPLEDANLQLLMQILADNDRYDVLDDVTPLLGESFGCWGSFLGGSWWGRGQGNLREWGFSDGRC